MTKDASWGDLSEVVGSRVATLRKRRGWSVEQFAERCTQAGASPLTVNALYVIENGRKEKETGRRRRHVTVDEFLALAYTLDVHPVDLLVSGDATDDEPYKITPKVTTTAAIARNWIGGQSFLHDPESPAELAEAIRFMPKERAQEMARTWFRPREAEWTRQTNAAELDDHV
jgi:transcriptional regulator with XRE-family HTH domain